MNHTLRLLARLQTDLIKANIPCQRLTDTINKLLSLYLNQINNNLTDNGPAVQTDSKEFRQYPTGGWTYPKH